MESKLLLSAIKRMIRKEREVFLWIKHLNEKVNRKQNSVESFEIKHGELHVIIDGVEANLGRVVGDDGINGVSGIDGKSIKGDKGDKGDTGAKGDDGKNGIDGRNGIDGKNGARGINGKDGAKGKDGVGISDVWIDKNGDLIILLTNNKQINAGRVVGKNGSVQIVGGAGNFLLTKQLVSESQTIIDAKYEWFFDTSLSSLNCNLYKGVDGDRHRIAPVGNNYLEIIPNGTDKLLGKNEPFRLYKNEALIITYLEGYGWY